MGGGFDPRSAAKVVKDDALEENVKKAAEEVIKKQVELGIDVITDGEVERGKVSSIFEIDVSILGYVYNVGSSH